MTQANFLKWLKAWLVRHPLRSPSLSATSYTEEVMARLRPSTAPAAVFAWLARPRLVVAMGTAVAAWLVIVYVGQTPQRRLANGLERDLALLAEDPEVLVDVSPDGLAQEVEIMDRIVLAEAEGVAEDEAWLEETLEFLNESGEEVDFPSDDEAAEEWMRELELFEEDELASS